MLPKRKPTNSIEFAKMRDLEEEKKRTRRKPSEKLPKLEDFPPVAIWTAEKLTEGWCHPDLRKIVMLAYCMYWEKLLDFKGDVPIPKPPGHEEYIRYSTILKAALSPVITRCPKCDWPRAEGRHCHACGDGYSEERVEKK